MNGSLLEPVYLPDLRDLTFLGTGEVSTIEFFLHKVTFPSTTRIAIGWRRLDNNLRPADVAPMLGWIPADCNPEVDPDFTFFLEWRSNRVGIAELCVAVLGTFAQDDVLSLSLSSHDQICLTPFARQIGQLPALKTLLLSRVDPSPFLLELDCDFPHEGDLSMPAPKYNHGLGPKNLGVDLRRQVKLDKRAIALLNKAVGVVWDMDPVEPDYPSSDADSDGDAGTDGDTDSEGDGHSDE
ncbi:hypothetical protein M413DRAFT_26710 [Hebeloma cylindrosporum]|uniref:Uncharacterized protein n=1 Tax=Hebeloma cylindrosporum TaxID=76867 RepID=A0A0C3C1F4_HEBCY|nr:hypothetical protein M413DRAFT_26710 [Hebeloma cylindrosporum h7]